MTKFADQLFDDLMREHGPTLAHTRPPAPRRHAATRRALLAVGGGGVAVAVAAAAGVLVATAGGNAAGGNAKMTFAAGASAGARIGSRSWLTMSSVPSGATAFRRL